MVELVWLIIMLLCLVAMMWMRILVILIMRLSMMLQLLDGMIIILRIILRLHQHLYMMVHIYAWILGEQSLVRMDFSTFLMMICMWSLVFVDMFLLLILNMTRYINMIYLFLIWVQSLPVLIRMYIQQMCLKKEQIKRNMWHKLEFLIDFKKLL